jgi:hypothetical protein
MTFADRIRQLKYIDRYGQGPEIEKLADEAERTQFALHALQALEQHPTAAVRNAATEMTAKARETLREGEDRD